MDLHGFNALAKEKNAHLWKLAKHGFYIEPEWCSRCLFKYEGFDGPVLDPACGTGRIVKCARDAGHEAFGSDIVKRRREFPRKDFFEADEWTMAENIVSNPPYYRADEFAQLALRVARQKVALLLSAVWHISLKRSIWLQRSPLRRVWFLTPRPSMPPGAMILAGEEPSGGTSDYAWYVWEHGYEGTPELRWLRKE